ncbi:MAG: hypothetical protein K2O70_01310, partial [Desulfovibrionaceae bacterium]|nr:hypothetical protein [Desulfovibrionaceae bacterium]
MANIKKTTCVQVLILLLGLPGGIAAWNVSAEAARISSAASAPVLLAAAPAQRRDYDAGTGTSPGSGTVHTYTDPATGDTVTDVIAPQPRRQEQQSTPIYVYPEVNPEWSPQGGSGGGAYPPGGNPSFSPPGSGGSFPPVPSYPPGNGGQYPPP